VGEDLGTEEQIGILKEAEADGTVNASLARSLAQLRVKRRRQV
jgi:hypothetical protein